MIAIRADRRDSDENFFRALPVYETPEGGRLGDFATVPAKGWWIAVTDVRGSTQAIREGRYRDVNLIGASSAIALLNLDRKLELPCVFGGDGVTLLIPERLVPDARRSLASVAVMARERFSLDLRCGLVPVSDAVTPATKLLVKRARISDHYSQFLFMGGALNHAVKLVKNEGSPYLVREAERLPEGADYRGLECRWDAVRPPSGGIHLLLISPSDRLSLEDQLVVLEECLGRITGIYGSAEERHPLKRDSYRLSKRGLLICKEVKVHSPTGTRLERWAMRQRRRLGNEIGRLYMATSAKVGGVDWGGYYRDVRTHTDCVKMDDVFRLVLSGGPEQLALLRAWLESQRARGRLRFGTHSSPEAIMTCMVFDRQSRHFHFVDGSDGGYALAAVELKAQLQAEA